MQYTQRMASTESLRARFNPLIRPYLVISIGVTMALTLIGIPLWRWLVLRRTVPGVYARDLPHA